jgi:hypothetical protein
MTFDDVRKIALAWPEVEDGTSYGTPALKVRKKLLARLKEDGDSLVMPGVPQDEREMLAESRPKLFYFTDHYRDYPIVLIRLSKAKRADVEPLLRRRWRRRPRSGIRRTVIVATWWASLRVPILRTSGWTETNFSRLRCAIPSTRSSPANCSISRCRTLGSSPDAWCRPSGMY